MDFLCPEHPLVLYFWSFLTSFEKEPNLSEVHNNVHVLCIK